MHQNICVATVLNAGVKVRYKFIYSF